MNKINFNYKVSVLAIVLKITAIIIVIGYVVASIFLKFGVAFALTGISYSLVLFTLATILQHVYEIKQLQEHTLLNKNEEDN